MKKIFLFFLFLSSLYCFKSSAQKDSIPKHQVYFNIGGQSSCFLGSRYIMPDTNIGHKVNLGFPYIGYYHLMISNFYVGMDYQFTLKNKYVFTCGLFYNDRRFAYESDSANLAKFKDYHIGYDTISKFDIHKNNFEINLSFGYSYKQFGFFIGAKIPLATFERKTKHSLKGNKSIENDEFITVFSGNFNQQVFFPEIIISYTIKFKKISPMVYVGFDDFIHFNLKRSYHLNLLYGVKIPIIPYNKHLKK
ncbi:MAG: hypothetical protein WCQ95_02035 [Bacteroidota bacterium]